MSIPTSTHLRSHSLSLSNQQNTCNQAPSSQHTAAASALKPSQTHTQISDITSSRIAQLRQRNIRNNQNKQQLGVSYIPNTNNKENRFNTINVSSKSPVSKQAQVRKPMFSYRQNDVSATSAGALFPNIHFSPKSGESAKINASISGAKRRNCSFTRDKEMSSQSSDLLNNSGFGSNQKLLQLKSKIELKDKRESLHLSFLQEKREKISFTHLKKSGKAMNASFASNHNVSMNAASNAIGKNNQFTTSFTSMFEDGSFQAHTRLKHYKMKQVEKVNEYKAKLLQIQKRKIQRKVRREQRVEQRERQRELRQRKLQIVYEEKEQLERAIARAALKIQSWSRMCLQRFKFLKELEDYNERVKEKLEQDLAELNEKIEHCWLYVGHQTTFAATLIQSVYRGSVSRKLANQLKYEKAKKIKAELLSTIITRQLYKTGLFEIGEHIEYLKRQARMKAQREKREADELARKIRQEKLFSPKTRKGNKPAKTLQKPKQKESRGPRKSRTTLEQMIAPKCHRNGSLIKVVKTNSSFTSTLSNNSKLSLNTSALPPDELNDDSLIEQISYNQSPTYLLPVLDEVTPEEETTMHNINLPRLSLRTTKNRANLVNDIQIERRKSAPLGLKAKSRISKFNLKSPNFKYSDSALIDNIRVLNEVEIKKSLLSELEKASATNEFQNESKMPQFPTRAFEADSKPSSKPPLPKRTKTATDTLKQTQKYVSKLRHISSNSISSKSKRKCQTVPESPLPIIAFSSQTEGEQEEEGEGELLNHQAQRNTKNKRKVSPPRSPRSRSKIRKHSPADSSSNKVNPVNLSVGAGQSVGTSRRGKRGSFRSNTPSNVVKSQRRASVFRKHAKKDQNNLASSFKADSYLGPAASNPNGEVLEGLEGEGENKKKKDGKIKVGQIPKQQRAYLTKELKKHKMHKLRGAMSSDTSKERLLNFFLEFWQSDETDIDERKKKELAEKYYAKYVHFVSNTMDSTNIASEYKQKTLPKPKSFKKKHIAHSKAEKENQHEQQEEPSAENSNIVEEPNPETQNIEERKVVETLKISNSENKALESIGTERTEESNLTLNDDLLDLDPLDEKNDAELDMNDISLRPLAHLSPRAIGLNHKKPMLSFSDQDSDEFSPIHKTDHDAARCYLGKSDGKRNRLDLKTSERDLDRLLCERLTKIDEESKTLESPFRNSPSMDAKSRLLKLRSATGEYSPVHKTHKHYEPTKTFKEIFPEYASILDKYKSSIPQIQKNLQRDYKGRPITSIVSPVPPSTRRYAHNANEYSRNCMPPPVAGAGPPPFVGNQYRATTGKGFHDNLFALSGNNSKRRVSERKSFRAYSMHQDDIDCINKYNMNHKISKIFKWNDQIKRGISQNRSARSHYLHNSNTISSPVNRSLIVKKIS